MPSSTHHRQPRPGIGSKNEEAVPGGFGLSYIWPEQVEQTSNCEASCPNGSNVRRWIAIVAQRNKLGLTTEEAYKWAWETIVDRNPFPATMGRICPHPCEDHCNRIEKDGAIAVKELERFIGDWGIEKGFSFPLLTRGLFPETIGVVGAGPAGLSFAYQMSRRGYAVTVIDRHDQAGGMMRYGIPDYRLPPAVLDAEIERILELGVELKLGVRVGQDVSVETLRSEYDVLFVGVGAQTVQRLGIPGEEGPGVFTGTNYLYRVNNGETVDIGSHVVVVGGGSTAIDAARTARRQDASVTVLYRRTKAEMTAIERVIDEAVEEGVRIEYLTAPLEIVRGETGVDSVRIRRVQSGDLDVSGCREQVPVEGSAFEIRASSVITAVSREPDWYKVKALNPDGGWMRKPPDGLRESNVYAGGDVTGVGIASMAIAHGLAEAEVAHTRLRGFSTSSFTSKGRIAGDGAGVKPEFYEDQERLTIDFASVEARLQNSDLEVSRTVTEELFLLEASRCLSCESCIGCQHCWMYCSAACFLERESLEPGRYYRLDLSVCEGCGKCIDVCPSGFLRPQ